MFDKLKFANSEFEKYKQLKGEYLHKQIYDVLLEINKENVLYSDLSSIIRYDKSLRDKLYIYLATLEEFLKAEIFRKYDVDNQDTIYKKVKFLINNAKAKTNNSESNLYYCFELCLGGIITFIKKKQMYDNDYINCLEKVRELRNKVMHHNLIVFGREKSIDRVMENLCDVKKMIQSLMYCLPDDYKKGFLKSINDLVCDVNVFKIVLE